MFHVRRLSPILAVLLLVTPSFAEDLKTLRKEYEDAKAKVGGAPKDRADKVQKLIVPILEKIGELNTNESLAFLVGELKTAIPEVAAACAGPIAKSSNESAPRTLLQCLNEKNRPVAVAIWEAFARSARNLKSVEGDMVKIAQGQQDQEVRRSSVPVLGKLDTLPAAKAILSHVQSGKATKGEDPQLHYNSAALAALRGTKSEGVKAWLARDAFSSASSDPARLALIARLAGDLKLEAARPELEKLVNHASTDVSAAAVASLSQVGFGGSAQDVAAMLEKRKGKGDVSFRIEALDSLARSNTDEALEVVLKAAQGNDAETRAIAMGSLSIFKDKPKAIEALAHGLEDSDASVRATALRALATKKDKAMIGPLIEVLGRDKEERLRIQAAELLARLTAQGQIGLVYEDWKKWWEIAQSKFEFPKEEAAGITSVKGQSQISYFGIEVSSRRASFLIDVSGSMLELVAVKEGSLSGDGEREKTDGKTSNPGGAGGGDPPVAVKDGKAKKIDVLKRELSRLLRKLPADMQINILTFHGTFNAWQQQLQPLSGAGRQKAISFVQGLQTGHGTNVFDTLEAALKDKRVDTIYLLTDGLPTAGRLREPGEICREVQSLNRLRGVTIHCVAFGEESKLLEQLAKENGGKYRFVNSY